MDNSNHKATGAATVPVGLQVIPAGHNLILFILSRDLVDGYRVIGDYLENNGGWATHTFSVAPAALPSPIMGQAIPAFAITVICVNENVIANRSVYVNNPSDFKSGF